MGLYRKVENLDAVRLAAEAIEETEDDLADENRRQLMAGYDRNGQKIGDYDPYKNGVYAIFKANMNPLPGLGNPDLYLEGDFHRGIYATVSGDVIHEDSTDEKAKDLEEKYGEEIYGLGGDFKKEYLDESVRPVFARKIEDATGLKMN